MQFSNYVTYERVQKAATILRPLCDQIPETALILGSGLGPLAADLKMAHKIAYEDIPGFPLSTAPSHQGDLLVGHLADKAVILLSGRFHLYEGWSASEIAFPLYVLKALGIKTLIVTNAAGALCPSYQPGDMMVVTDHLNLTGQNPLIGQQDARLGPRFPDMSQAYSVALSEKFMAFSQKHQCRAHQGIYAGITGPSLETSAERRFLRASGADAVGMSTVTEVIAAKHVGMSVLGLSAITNMATGGAEQQPDSLEEVMANAVRAGQKIQAPLFDLLASF